MSQGHWRTRIQLSMGDEDRARLAVGGLRANGHREVTRRDSVVVVVRHLRGVYANDSISAAFHALHGLWDNWPQDVRKPASRLTVSTEWKP